MEILDISMILSHDMVVYKDRDEKRPDFKVVRDFKEGGSFETSMSMNMHTGSHVDAPLHMVEGGDTVDRMDLYKVVTPCRVIDFTTAEGAIKARDFENKSIETGDFIILKTKNSYIEGFDWNFVYLEKSGAEYLKNKGVKGVGIDSLGIERSQEGHETHKTLLGAGIVILEGLRLKEVEEGEYFLVAAPLKINGAEASPVRAILIKGLV